MLAVAVVLGFWSQRRMNEAEIAQARLNASREISVLQKQTARARRSAPPEKPSSADFTELLRLRNLVTQLQSELESCRRTSTNLALVSSNRNKTAVSYAIDSVLKRLPNVLPADLEARQILAQKEAELKEWWDLVVKFAQEHDGWLPASAADLAPYWPNDFAPTLPLQDWGWPSGGTKLSEVSKKSPLTTIFRDSEKVTLSDGTVCITCLFGDGTVMLFKD